MHPDWDYAGHVKLAHLASGMLSPKMGPQLLLFLVAVSPREMTQLLCLGLIAMLKWASETADEDQVS